MGQFTSLLGNADQGEQEQLVLVFLQILILKLVIPTLVPRICNYNVALQIQSVLFVT